MSPYQHTSRPTSHPRSRHRKRKSRRSLALIVPAVAALAVLVMVGYAFAGSSDRIAAGVEIAGINVGGLTSSQAHQKLEKASRKLTWVPVKLVAKGKRFEVAPAQLGIAVDWDAAIARARRDGDGTGPLRGFKRLEMRLLGSHIKPPVKLSPPALKALLATIAKRVDKSALEPALVVNGSQLSVVPGRKGRELDKKRAADMVVKTLGSLTRGTVVLPVRVVAPRVRRSDLVRVEGQVRTVVSAPVQLKLGAVRWTILPAQIRKMLEYPHDGERNLSIGGHDADVFLASLAKQLDRPAKNAAFGIAGRSIHVVPARIGRVLDRERTSSAILSAARRAFGRTASLVMKSTQPRRTTEQAKAMGITGLVGSYETSFTGIANRIHNVQLVAKLIDNKFVAPGAVFSFNKTTGQRDSKKGFLTAPVIMNGEVTEGLGGGVCQVSTTTFNAAFEAGLDILERTNHALYISHYPLGRDATVNWPSPDLKFRNDTDHWLLIRTFSGSGTLLVALYGEPQHRRVESSATPLRITGGPPLKRILDPSLAVGTKEIEDPGQSSSTTSVHRLVYGADGKLLHDNTWYSSYRSSPKIVRVGTKAPKKDKGKGTTDTTTTDTTTTDTTTTDTTTTDTTTISTG
jgi:vancomycin resistance protein YoaR